MRQFAYLGKRSYLSIASKLSGVLKYHSGIDKFDISLLSQPGLNTDLIVYPNGILIKKKSNFKSTKEGILFKDILNFEFIEGGKNSWFYINLKNSFIIFEFMPEDKAEVQAFVNMLNFDVLHFKDAAILSYSSGKSYDKMGIFIAITCFALASFYYLYITNEAFRDSVIVNILKEIFGFLIGRWIKA